MGRGSVGCLTYFSLLYSSVTSTVRHPGVVCVFASRRATDTVDYTKGPSLRAPGLSHLTTTNVLFGGTCYATPLDNPSHKTVFAKCCPSTMKLSIGKSPVPSSLGTRALNALVGGTNCSYTCNNG